MKKADIIDMVHTELEGTKAQADRVVNMIFDTIGDEMAKGSEVDIAGFGKMIGQHKPARTARNPKTGEPVQVAAKIAPKFKASKTLKDKVAGK
ncbi:MAG: HU family DNA-binding protein [Candidatus Nomurabacteria bacterium]|nr:HU family DNA-binding protein [Candidatus Nomurabacteria bacterium]